MTITPCRTCHLKADCQIKKDKLKGIRGLKLTAIRFRCNVLRDSFVPGMKATADLKFVAVGYSASFDSNEILTEERTVEAVVMGWSSYSKGCGKVRIYVPYPEDGPDWWLESYRNRGKYIHVMLVSPDQLHIQQGLVIVCDHCGLPKGAELKDWNCRNFEDGLNYGCTYEGTPLPDEVIPTEATVEPF